MTEMSIRKSYRSVVCVCVLAWAVVGLFSCSEDEKFTSSPNEALRFSSDTISFDTIFTDIGSATKVFKIYNPNSKGVRLVSVRLGSDGESGFRMNLDGDYGTRFTDVEIYSKDSMYCFVEVTVDPNDSDSPTLITDSILFTMENGLTRKVMLEAYGQDIVVMEGQVITSDTTWASVRPVVVRDSLVVAPNATLTIAEGTTVCFHKLSGLDVYGTLKVEGTQEKPVTLRGDRTDKLFTYLPYDRLDAQWEGVRLHPESHGNTFNYCDIHGGNYGIIADNDSLSEGVKCTVSNSVIHNVAGDALFLHSTTACLSNSQISNAGGNCVTVIGGTTRFVHCTVAQFYPWHATRGSALYFANVYDKKEYPLELIEFVNCIVTGSSSDEVYGSKMQDSEAAFNYRFRNSLVNTVTTEDDAQYFTGCKLDRDEGESDSSDKTILRGENFRTIDNSVYYYDFRLDSLSTARGLGDGTLTPDDCRTDMNGVERPTENPDAGCYQFEDKSTGPILRIWRNI